MKLPDSFYQAEKDYLDTPSQHGDDSLVCYVCGEPIEGDAEEDEQGHDLCKDCYELFLEEIENEEAE